MPITGLQLRVIYIPVCQNLDILSLFVCLLALTSIVSLVCLFQIILASIDFLEHLRELHLIKQKGTRIFVMSKVLKINVCTCKKLNKSNYWGLIKARRYFADQLRSQFYKILIQIQFGLNQHILQETPFQVSFLVDYCIQITQSQIHKKSIVESIQFLQQIFYFSERHHDLKIVWFIQMIGLILVNNGLELDLMFQDLTCEVKIELTE